MVGSFKEQDRAESGIEKLRNLRAVITGNFVDAMQNETTAYTLNLGSTGPAQHTFTDR